MGNLNHTTHLNSKATPPATRSLWETHEMDAPKKISISFRFTEADFQKIKQGLIPEEMEDKWFIFYEEGWLYFHRSWTGFGTYKAEIVKEGDTYYIREFQAERNAEKYSNVDDDLDRKDFIFLIARGLLKITVAEMPFLNENQTDAQVLGEWSTFGNMLFGK